MRKRYEKERSTRAKMRMVWKGIRARKIGKGRTSSEMRDIKRGGRKRRQKGDKI